MQRIRPIKSLTTCIVWLLLLTTGRINAQEVTNGLVGYYTFCSCTATDYSGNNRDGTVVGSPQCVRGILDYGFLLNQSPGSNGCGQAGGEYIALPPTTPIWSEGFTVCAWVKFDEIKHYERIIDFSNGDGKSGGLPIWFGREGNSNNLTLESWINSNGGQARSTGRLVAPNAITNGSIEYYCATISGDTMRIYVNGALAAEKRGNPILNIARAQNYIGRSAWCSNDPDFKGFMDEVRIYNRGLTAAEIASLYKVTNVKDFKVQQVCTSTTVNFSIDSSTRIDSIAWHFGDAGSGIANTTRGFTTSHNFSAAGIYTVQAIAYKTCLNDTIVKQVRIGTYENFLGPDFNLCKLFDSNGSPVYGNGKTLKVDFPGATYLWQDGSTQNSFSVTTPGTYWLQLNVNGCVYNDTVLVNSNQVASTVKMTICEGQKYLGYTATGTYINTYKGPNGCDSIRTLELLVLPKSIYTIDKTICRGQSYLGHTVSGTYKDTLVAANGCDSIKVINLKVETSPVPDLGRDTAVCVNDMITLTPGLFTSYLWQDGSTRPTFEATTPGSYSVTVTNTCGSAKDEIKIVRDNCEIYFPTAFTPNKDGRNEEFKILDLRSIQEYYLVIYNRWGQKVFETMDYRKGWDGSYNGIAQETNLFVWFCKLKLNGKSQTLEKGTVFLIR